MCTTVGLHVDNCRFACGQTVGLHVYNFRFACVQL